MSHMVAARIDDLMFISRLNEACRKDGFQLHVIQRRYDLPEKADVLVVDLTLDAADFGVALGQANMRGIPSLGFAPHVRSELFDEAHRLGVTLVVPNGQFSSRAAELIHHLLHDQAKGSPERSHD